jgi:hypothetical protein
MTPAVLAMACADFSLEWIGQQRDCEHGCDQSQLVTHISNGPRQERKSKIESSVQVPLPRLGTGAAAVRAPAADLWSCISAD